MSQKKPFITEFVVIGKNHSVTLPQSVISSLNIKEGARLLIVADVNKMNFVAYPIIREERMLAEVRVRMLDKPGALGEIATELGKMGINIQTTVIPPGTTGVADAYFVVDCTGSKTPLPEVEERLKRLKNTVEVEVNPLE
ncbi:MAG: ACT domain-containing protein [Candidatus Freyarchaeota archaeon]|nr:ACT domain-containing protein [Candidatus Jordarchaeia archaeon]